MKNMENHYLNSYLSELYPDLKISGRNLTVHLRKIGVQRENIVEFFKEFSSANDNILFDGTDMLSNSKKMELPQKSKTKKGVFDQVINFMFIFSTNQQLPTYYKALSGNIKDIKAFKLCLKESGIKDATIIADKGFYSKSNVLEMKKERLNYIIPLRRNSSLISYETIKNGNKSKFDGYFMYQKRVIWYYKTKVESEDVYVFMDEELKNNEIKDYLNRVDSLPEKYNIDTFHQKQYAFGTVAMVSNLYEKPEKIYKEYKARGEIEGMIDVLKNTFDADKSYMQDEKALEAWMFINFIALHWYYKIIHKLKECDLNKKYSPKDIIEFLSNIKKVRINNTWHKAEITKKNEQVLKTLGLHIT
jgi:transposase